MMSERDPTKQFDGERERERERVTHSTAQQSTAGNPKLNCHHGFTD